MQIQEELAGTELTPVQTLLDIAGGYALPRCLHVVADFGVADVLEETPRTATELARAPSVDANALGRVLRLLAAQGISAPSVSQKALSRVGEDTLTNEFALSRRYRGNLGAFKQMRMRSFSEFVPHRVRNSSPEGNFGTLISNCDPE